MISTAIVSKLKEGKLTTFLECWNFQGRVTHPADKATMSIDLRTRKIVICAKQGKMDDCAGVKRIEYLDSYRKRLQKSKIKNIQVD